MSLVWDCHLRIRLLLNYFRSVNNRTLLKLPLSTLHEYDEYLGTDNVFHLHRATTATYLLCTHLAFIAAHLQSYSCSVTYPLAHSEDLPSHGSGNSSCTEHVLLNCTDLLSD